ncbi:MAG TPA: hypothetical protein VMV20_08545, partial [Chitinophagaceae bacterium]|nr:hypothetical protein [Chitinophagaceae bacterium]
MILYITIFILLASLDALYHLYGARKTLRIAGISLLSFLGLILLLAILVHFTAVQNFLVRQASKRLSAQLKTEVRIGHVRFEFFDRMLLQDALVEDRNQDTLFYAGLITVRVTDFFFLKKRPVLHYVRLDHTRINLSRNGKDPVWNYQFLLDALSSPGANSDTGKNGMDLDLRQLDLTDLIIRKTDGWDGSDMTLSLSSLHLNARSLDLKKKTLSVNEIRVISPRFTLRDYPGHTPAASTPSENAQSGGTPLHLFAKLISVKNGSFSLSTQNQAPVPGYFDPGNIRWTAINATLTNTRMVRDSLFTRLVLSGKEGSGLEVRKLSARFKLSPVEMEFADLDLQTNRSVLRNYFAMHFSRFSDLGDFLQKVSMVARFQGCTLSSDDLAIFAPTFSGWHMSFQARGEIRGTVANLNARGLDLRSRS